MEPNTRRLVHKPTGIVYAYQEVFALRADFEEIQEPAAPVEAADTAKPRSRKAKPEAAEPVALTAEENAEAIGADASRNLP